MEAIQGVIIPLFLCHRWSYGNAQNLPLSFKKIGVRMM
jgi:hypothetical protein